jgi:hypothetical protein
LAYSLKVFRQRRFRDPKQVAEMIQGKKLARLSASIFVRAILRACRLVLSINPPRDEKRERSPAKKHFYSLSPAGQAIPATGTKEEKKSKARS